MRPLADLPDVPGYTFIGIDREGLKFPCVIRLDPEEGACGAYTLNGTPCLSKLSGWMPASGTSSNGWDL